MFSKRKTIKSFSMLNLSRSRSPLQLRVRALGKLSNRGSIRRTVLKGTGLATFGLCSYSYGQGINYGTFKGGHRLERDSAKVTSEVEGFEVESGQGTFCLQITLNMTN